MAYYDLLGQNAYGQYNRELARKIGLKPAVYIAEITNILMEVLRKNKYDHDSGEWTLQREYLSLQTTLTEEEQMQCEDIFIKLGVIKRSSKNVIMVSLETVENLIMGKVEIPQTIFDLPEAKPTYNKKEMIVWNLKKHAASTDPEIKAALDSWVESISAIKGKLTAPQVESFSTSIQNFTGTKEEKLTVIATCKQAGWLVADWAFKSVRTRQTAPTYSRLPEQQISDGNLGTEEF